MYDRKNDYRWMVDRRVPSIAVASYDELGQRTMVDVLVSPKPLELR